MIRLQQEGREPLVPAIPLATPFVISVDPSSICNFKCKFCYQSSGKMKNKGIMKWSTYKKIISDIKEFDRPIKTLRLYAFGEPLINPLFPDMIKHAKQENICERIDTTTNGSLFHPKLNRDIINSGIDRINISVEGVDEKSYLNFSKCKINFNRFADNISHLYQNKGECIIFIKINGDIINKEEQDKFLEIFTPISDGIAIEHLINCWPDFNVNGVNKEVGIYGQPLKEVKACPYIFYSFCIHYDGEISACFLDWNKKLIIGDINNKSVKELWNGKVLNTSRKMMLSGFRCRLPICSNCQQLISGQPENIDQYKEELLGRFE